MAFYADLNQKLYNASCKFCAVGYLFAGEGNLELAMQCVGRALEYIKMYNSAGCRLRDIRDANHILETINSILATPKESLTARSLEETLKEFYDKIEGADLVAVADTLLPQGREASAVEGGRIPSASAGVTDTASGTDADAEGVSSAERSPVSYVDGFYPESSASEEETDSAGGQTEVTETDVRDGGKDGRAATVTGNALRPMHFSDFVGQASVIKMLSDEMEVARLQGAQFPHTLLTGGSGLGKTTIAKIIANEMGGKCYELSATRISAKELREILTKLRPCDVLFIDEIHILAVDRSGKTVLESLYSAMEDGSITVVHPQSGSIETIPLKFTLVAATTDSGLLPKPFVNRFSVKCNLLPYSAEELFVIVKNLFNTFGIECEDAPVMMIAERSRGIPREAVNYSKKIKDQILLEEAKRRNMTESGCMSDPQKIREMGIRLSGTEAVTSYFDRIGVDEKGLRAEERALLTLIIERFDGGPVGLKNLSSALNIEEIEIKERMEPYLVQLALLQITTQGRCATSKAYEYLGIEKR